MAWGLLRYFPEQLREAWVSAFLGELVRQSGNAPYNLRRAAAEFCGRWVAIIGPDRVVEALQLGVHRVIIDALGWDPTNRAFVGRVLEKIVALVQLSGRDPEVVRELSDSGLFAALGEVVAKDARIGAYCDELSELL